MFSLVNLIAITTLYFFTAIAWLQYEIEGAKNLIYFFTGFVIVVNFLFCLLSVNNIDKKFVGKNLNQSRLRFFDFRYCLMIFTFVFYGKFLIASFWILSFLFHYIFVGNYEKFQQKNL